MIDGKAARRQGAVEAHLRPVLDDEVLVRLAGPILEHGVVVAVLRLVRAGGVQIDLVVAPAGQVAQIGADRRRAAAEIEVIAGAHQAVDADAGAGDVVAVALAVIVHVREAAQQMAVLVTERADAQIGRRAAEAGEQIQIGPMLPNCRSMWKLCGQSSPLYCVWPA